jgi:NAD(P)-dependent dehydrogenase (short-subunit alcohol dehydrogenase family)
MAALELARHKIRVNVICPGRIATEIQQNTQTAAKVSGGIPGWEGPIVW